MTKKFLWANSINMSGLYSDKPIKVTPYGSLDTWYDEEGNFDVVPIEGPFSRADGLVHGFVSSDALMVQTWTIGAMAMALAVKSLVEWPSSSTSPQPTSSGDSSK